MSSFRKQLTVAAVALVITTSAWGNNEWLGGNSGNLWSDPANWNDGAVPASATVLGVDNINVAVIVSDGLTMVIDSTVNATAFGLQIGSQQATPPGTGSTSTNTLIMTGGTLTTQGNFLFNVGRGRNTDPTQVVNFNMSGGLVNAAGITVPEQFSVQPGDLPITANVTVSGNSIINTDLLRLGAANSNATMTLSDNAQVNLTDDNMGFASGALWIEAFEAPVVGTSFLDIRDNAVLTIHGEWWTDENGDGTRGAATATEAQYFRDNYIANNWIVGNGGGSLLDVTFAGGVITIRVGGVCGDSLPGGGEECDDGNTSAGDGCSSTCTVEPDFSCSDAIAGNPPTPSACFQCNPGGIEIACDDGLDDDCDGLIDGADPDCAPLAVTLEAFTAERTPQGVRLRWTTVSEEDNFGFRILRGLETNRKSGETVDIEQVSAGIIPSQGTALFGAQYVYLDSLVHKSGVVVYYLEDIDTSGVVTRHGPLRVDLTGAKPGRKKLAVGGR